MARGFGRDRMGPAALSSAGMRWEPPFPCAIEVELWKWEAACTLQRSRNGRFPTRRARAPVYGDGDRGTGNCEGLLGRGAWSGRVGSIVAASVWSRWKRRMSESCFSISLTVGLPLLSDVLYNILSFLFTILVYDI